MAPLHRSLLLAGAAVALTACGAESGSDVEVFESQVAAATGVNCSSDTMRIMAALAIAMGNEMGRWEATTDLSVNASTGRVQVSTAGYNACLANGKTGCKNVVALLEFQRNDVGNFLGHDATALKEELKARLERQKVAESRPDNGVCDNACAESHTVKFSSTSTEGNSCGNHFWYQASKAGCTGASCALQYPELLATKLGFAGYPDNDYLAFTTKNGKVGIDPTSSLVNGGSGANPICYIGSTIISTTNVAGSCCNIDGKYGTLSKSFWSANTYYCYI